MLKLFPKRPNAAPANWHVLRPNGDRAKHLCVVGGKLNCELSREIDATEPKNQSGRFHSDYPIQLPSRTLVLWKSCYFCRG